MHDPNEESAGARRVPRAAAWLGGLGAVPFIALAISGPLIGSAERIQASFALLAYGGVILAFLGGINWGLATNRADASKDPSYSPRRLFISVIPSLVAWLALLLPTVFGLILLALGFASMLMVDLRAAARGEAPCWYPSLRIPLTVIVVVTLIGGAGWAR